MDDVIELIMEFIQDVITDFFSDKIFGLIKTHVESKLLRGLYYTLTVLVLVAVAVAIVFGIASLVGLVFT